MKIEVNDENKKALKKLLNELYRGRKSGEKNGWLTLETVEQHLGISKE